MRPSTRALLAVAGVALAAALAAYGPIPQPPGLHVMADRRTIAGIPNAMDVVSNAAFLVVGLIGLVVTLRSTHDSEDGADRWPYAALFAATILTAFGSAYYHLAPDNARLVWDRLPMAIGFMALLAIVIGDYVDRTLARWLFLPLLAAGAASVLYWYATERAGVGDLRPYICVQFGSLALVLAILIERGRDDRTRHLFAALALYALAKALETADAPILALNGLVSGHTLKHLAGAAAVFAVVQSWRWSRVSTVTSVSTG